MNITNTVGRGVTWNLIATAGVKILTLGTLLIILRNLTLYQYGQVELLLASITTVSLFTLPALSSVAIADIGVEIGRGNLSRAQGLYLSFARLFTGLGFLTALGVAAVVYLFGTLFFGSQPIALFILGIPLVATGTWRTLLTVLLQVHLSYAATSIFSMVEEAFKLIVVAALIFIFHLGPYAVVLSIIASQILSQLCFLPYALRLYRSWGSAREKISSLEFFKPHTRWSILSGFAGTLSQTMRPWLVKVTLGTEAVAVFAVAWGLISQIVAIMPLSDVLTPLFPQAYANSGRFRMLMEKGMRYQVLGYIAAGIAAFITFPFLVRFFFPNYAVALPLFKVLLLLLIPTGFDLFTPIFLTLKAQKNMFFATLVKILYYAIFMPLGAYFGGLLGLGLGLVLATVLYTFERYSMLKRLVPNFRVLLRDFFFFDEYDAMLFRLTRRKIFGALSYFV